MTASKNLIFFCIYLVHVVLWCGKTAQELMEMDIVTAEIPKEEEDPELRALVMKYQIHRCTAYCTPAGAARCRFNFPFLANERTEILNNRVVYKRGGDEGYVNTYNPFFLRLLQVNMDMQINLGRRSLNYMAKYLSKPDIACGIHLDRNINNMDNQKVHLKNREVSAVECIYDLFGWPRHKSKTGTMVLQTSLPGFERRALKRKLDQVDPESTDIYMESQIEKYCKRARTLESLTFPEYYTFYSVGQTSQARENEENEHLEDDGEDEFHDADNNQVRVQTEYYPTPLPVKVRDQKNRIYSLRRKKAFWRTHYVLPSTGEGYFFQKIVLQLPSFDFHSLYESENRSWRRKYIHIFYDLFFATKSGVFFSHRN